MVQQFNLNTFNDDARRWLAELMALRQRTEQCMEETRILLVAKPTGRLPDHEDRDKALL